MGAREFKYFKKPAPKSPESKLEKGINIAIAKGRSAEKNDRLRSENPYMPSQVELYEAWNFGYDDEDQVYSIRK